MISLEEHLENSGELLDFSVQSAVCYARHHPGISLRDALCGHTLFRYVVRSSYESASNFSGAAEDLIRQIDNDPTEALSRSRPEIMRSIRDSYPDSLQPDPRYPKGRCVRGETNPALPPSWAVIHFANVISPGSFLREEAYFAACLRDTALQLRLDCHCDTLYTFTWLNSLDRFLRFFPPEWICSSGEPCPDILDNLGFQGQFLTGRGGLNHHCAKEYLASGKLPYPPRKSFCSISALLDTLKTRFDPERCP